jgi:hypothetical protein
VVIASKSPSISSGRSELKVSTHWHWRSVSFGGGNVRSFLLFVYSGGVNYRDTTSRKDSRSPIIATVENEEFAVEIVFHVEHQMARTAVQDLGAELKVKK